MSSQLGRTLLSCRSVSADQQDAAPDETGSYGGRMDEIDRIIEPTQVDAQDRLVTNMCADQASLPEGE